MVDRETTCEKLIMIVVSLILEIKKENCFLRITFLKTFKRQITRSTLSSITRKIKVCRKIHPYAAYGMLVIKNFQPFEMKLIQVIKVCRLNQILINSRSLRRIDDMMMLVTQDW